MCFSRCLQIASLTALGLSAARAQSAGTGIQPLNSRQISRVGK
jgi:hypothetical protein